ncbi:hypothetical protein WISP_89756 [Willisornis vidua]|uniref:Uncharacterized protein n=1 Tax=Willisornis vidua TaxID=1566151 RepID=A0ABQ9D6B4_9PASS|nr:hypothetical protein WISP_89756 [Willisornis vidua]
MSTLSNGHFNPLLIFNGLEEDSASRVLKQWQHAQAALAAASFGQLQDGTSTRSVEAAVTSIEAMLLRMQLHWTGHGSRMEDHCLPKTVLCGELATSCRKRGAPKRRYKDSLKQYLSLGHIDYINGPLRPPIGIHGDTPFTMLLLLLRMHAESVSGRKELCLTNIT